MVQDFLHQQYVAQYGTGDYPPQAFARLYVELTALMIVWQPVPHSIDVLCRAWASSRLLATASPSLPLLPARQGRLSHSPACSRAQVSTAVVSSLCQASLIGGCNWHGTPGRCLSGAFCDGVTAVLAFGCADDLRSDLEPVTSDLLLQG